MIYKVFRAKNQANPVQVLDRRTVTKQTFAKTNIVQTHVVSFFVSIIIIIITITKVTTNMDKFNGEMAQWGNEVQFAPL